MIKLHQLLLKTPFQTYVCLLENHKLLIMISLTSVSNMEFPLMVCLTKYGLEYFHIKKTSFCFAHQCTINKIYAMHYLLKLMPTEFIYLLTTFFSKRRHGIFRISSYQPSIVHGTSLTNSLVNTQRIALIIFSYIKRYLLYTV